jgi:hypothetical protein
LLAVLIAGPCLGQADAPAESARAPEIRRIPAAEANQGVTADERFLYVIDNRVIGKYDRASGARVGGWEGTEGGPIRHLNAGVVREGRLHVAHSNYPAVPMLSSIEVWDTETLRHLDSHSFGIHSGSATWVDFHDGSWWVAFANYDNRGGTPGRGVEWSTVERFDRDWRQTGAWVFPDSLVSRFRPYSNSGGFWSSQGVLHVTGHDAPEIYLLRLPEAGSTLEWIGTIAAPIEGQGIGRDPRDPKSLFAIDRGRREVIELRLPASSPAGRTMNPLVP